MQKPPPAQHASKSMLTPMLDDGMFITPLFELRLAR
jgi:hypothetical protein